MNYDDEDQEIEDMIGMLVEAGAMKVHGMLENGEITYVMVPDVLKDVLPDLYDVLMDEINAALVELLDAGYINVEYDENLVPRFFPTEEGNNLIKDLQIGGDHLGD